MPSETFEAYKSRKHAEGYDEVILREWAADFANQDHTHPFDADVTIAHGEFWLTLDGKTTHYQSGDRFVLPRGTVHSERYGPQGAVFWAARRN